MRVLVSAYACEPAKGSEAGAGYSLLRAAADHAEVWLLTRSNNVAPLKHALDRWPPANPVHVIGLDGSERALAIKRRFGIVRPYYAYWQRLAAERAAALIPEIRPDLVHHATMSAFWFPIGVGRLELPLVVGPLSGGTTTPSALLRYLGLRGLVYDGVRFATGRVAAAIARRTWMRNTDVLLVQNQTMADFALARLLAAPEQLIIQSHAAAPDLSDLPVGVLDTMDRGRDVIFVGRLVSWKGPILAARAFAQARVAASRLVFVGDGPDRKRLERVVRSEGIADRVHFAGQMPRPEVLRMMRSAAALLFPSFHDSAGFVVSEAQSLGLPVICLDHGGPGTLVRVWPSVPHVAVPVTSGCQVRADLAKAIRRFVEQPEHVPEGLQDATPTLTAQIGRAYAIATAG